MSSEVVNPVRGATSWEGEGIPVVPLGLASGGSCMDDTMSQSSVPSGLSVVADVIKKATSVGTDDPSSGGRDPLADGRLLDEGVVDVVSF